MSFTIWDYAIPGGIIPLSIVVLLLVLACILSRRLSKKQRAFQFSIFPILLWLTIVLCGLWFGSEGFKYPISAWLAADVPHQITVGQVTDIYDAPSPPMYYNRNTHSLQPAKFLVVDGAPYYVLQANVAIGEWVTIQWSTNERVVYQLDNNCNDVYTDIEPFHPPVNIKQQDHTTLGTTITNISFLCLCAMVVLLYPIGKRIAPVMIAKDQTVTDGLIPNHYGLFHYGIIFFLVLGLLFGYSLSGFMWGRVLIAILFPIWIWILILKRSVRLHVENKHLIYKELRTEQRVSLDDVTSVVWRRSGIPYNRALVIRLRSTRIPIILEQEHYYGLSYIYQALTQSSEGANRTGVGSLS